MDESFLARRLAALRAGDRAVPLDYEALRAAARDHLEAAAFDYAASGAGAGRTLEANRAAFERHRIVTRVLRDVADRDLGVDLFGRHASAPVVLAPIGGQGRYHEAGELATARAAAELGVPMAVSTVTTHPVEAIAAAAGDGPWYFQLYWPRDWDVAESLVRRADDAGCDAVVLTVDSQVPTWRRRFLRHGTGRETHRGTLETDPVVGALAEAAGQPVEAFVRESPALRKDASLTWDDLDALRGWTDRPVVLKGVLSPADARRAVDWGADGLVVSNHGGRQIDGEVAALDQLPAVVDAVDGAVPILLDSGVRSGADAFTALALGADAVLVGRPYVFGLAVAGQVGVSETVANLLAELESTMGLAGYATVAEIDGDALVDAPLGGRGESG